MANAYGTNPLVYDTNNYTTGTVAITKGSTVVTGTTTTWTTSTHPSSSAATNRDRVTEISVDSGVNWYVVASREGNTELKLERPFAEDSVSGVTYLTRIRRIPRIKVNAIQWLNPTANDELVFRDKDHNVIAIIRAGTLEQETLIFGTPHWVDGLALGALPSGVAYVYYD